MDKVYTYISPGPIGTTSTNTLSSGLINQARNHSVTISEVRSKLSFTLDNTATYIKKLIFLVRLMK